MFEPLQRINTAVIEELVEIKKSREVLAGRLERLENEREKVSVVVFERVGGDYRDQLAALARKAAPLKEQARAEYEELRRLLGGVEKALAEARLDQEETELRHRLGELEGEAYEARATEVATRLTGHEAELAEVTAMRERFLGAVDSEEELVAAAKGEPEPAAAEPEPAAGGEVAPEEPATSWMAVEQAPVTQVGASQAPPAAVVIGEAVEPVLVTLDEETLEPVAGPAGAALDAVTSVVTAMEEGVAPALEAAAGAAADAAEEDEATAERVLPLPAADLGAPAEVGEDRIDLLGTTMLPVMSGDAPPPPPPRPRARLVFVEEDPGGPELLLDHPTMVIGRLPHCEIQLDRPAVSRRHAEILLTPSGYLLRDLGSENGTYVNGESISEYLLADGDQVNVGAVALVFRAG